MRLKKNLGQSIAEYATLIAIVIAVLATMKIWLSRMFMRGTTHAVVANLVGETSSLGSTVQWEPDYMRSDKNRNQSSTTIRDINRGGAMSESSSYNVTVDGFEKTLAVGDDE